MSLLQDNFTVLVAGTLCFQFYNEDSFFFQLSHPRFKNYHGFGIEFAQDEAKLLNVALTKKAS